MALGRAIRSAIPSVGRRVVGVDFVRVETTPRGRREPEYIRRWRWTGLARCLKSSVPFRPCCFLFFELDGAIIYAPCRHRKAGAPSSNGSAFRVHDVLGPTVRLPRQNHSRGLGMAEAAGGRSPSQEILENAGRSTARAFLWACKTKGSLPSWNSKDEFF